MLQSHRRWKYDSRRGLLTEHDEGHEMYDCYCTVRGWDGISMEGKGGVQGTVRCTLVEGNHVRYQCRSFRISHVAISCFLHVWMHVIQGCINSSVKNTVLLINVRRQIFNFNDILCKWASETSDLGTLVEK